MKFILCRKVAYYYYSGNYKSLAFNMGHFFNESIKDATIFTNLSLLRKLVYDHNHKESRYHDDKLYIKYYE